MIISIEGNIGSGKTTLLSMLQTQLGDYMGRSRPVVYVKEPVSEWESIKDEAGMSMLDHLYKDSKTHAFAFQMMAYITRLRTLREAKKAHPGAILVTERCLQTDCHVFAKMLKDSGDIMGIHYQIYDKWASALSPDLEPNLYVYVRADPAKSLERVKIRNRSSESSMSLGYLTACHQKHEEWLTTVDKDKVIMFDGNEEFVGDKAHRVTDLAKQLAEFKV